MGIGDAIMPEMEYRCRQNGAGMAFADASDQMVEIAHTPARDNRNVDRIGNCAGERKVIAVARAIPVHARHQ